jgi:polar amino acid transport system substrate-binding protein
MRSFVRLCFSCLALVLSLGGAAHAQQPLVKVGYAPFATPLSFIDAKTNLATGAYVDLMTAIAKDLGLRVEFHPLLGGDMLPALNAKIVDMSVTGINVAPSTAAQADFSNPVLTFGEAMVVKKTDTREYKSLDDLKGEAVGANAGTIYADMLQKSGLFKEVKVYGGDPVVLAAVSSGEIKAYFGSALVAPANVARASDLQIVKTYTPRLEIGAAFGFRKGQQDLVTQVNASLSKLKADGTQKSIFAKYDLNSLIK